MIWVLLVTGDGSWLWAAAVMLALILRPVER